MEVNKDKIANQLNKRHRERQDQLNAKLELTKLNTSEKENSEFFQETYRNRIHLIEKKLNGLSSGTIDKITLAQNIQTIFEDIQKQQNYLTSSTFFLSNYTVKIYQENIEDLRSRTETIKNKLLAKKRFNFQTRMNNASKSITTVDLAPKQSITDQPSNKTVHTIDWTVRNRKNDEILLSADETNNKDITISSLESCLIRIEGHPSSLQISNLKKCVVFCGPISRSVFADNCTDCKFVFGCQQLRLHTSHNCDLYMHVTCRAIIEDCDNINVAPYIYENMENDFIDAGLDFGKNNWDDVADFNWLSSNMESPNWKRIAPEKRISDWESFLNEFRKMYTENVKQK